MSDVKAAASKDAQAAKQVVRGDIAQSPVKSVLISLAIGFVLGVVAAIVL